MAVLDVAEHLIGENIHGVGDGASRRTFLALETGLDLFTAGLIHFRQERIFHLISLRVSIHPLPLNPGRKDFPGLVESLDEREAQSEMSFLPALCS